VIAQDVFPGIYLLPGAHGSFNSYAYALAGDKPLLVDTIVRDKAAGLIVPAVAELELKPAQIVITHGHADHFGGLGLIHAAYPQASVAAHAADVRWIESVEVYLEEMYRQYGRAAGFPIDETRLDWVRSLISPPTTVTKLLEPGRAVGTGRFELEVFHVPGHSPGHIALVDRERRFALAADALLGNGIIDRNGQRPFAPIYTDPVAYRQTLHTIRDWKVGLLLTGHLAPMCEDSAAAFLDQSEHFIDECENVIQAALDAAAGGLDFAQLAGQVDAALGPFLLGLPGFPCVLAHLRDLEQRGLARRTESAGGPAWFRAP
jgi:glyoxylase-like metal-dependent hydrolase (beta-lactamase superfamily II)